MNGDKVLKDIASITEMFTEIFQLQQQSLQSQQLLLLALSEQAADVPRLSERYQALLREHERATGAKLPVLPIGQ